MIIRQRKVQRIRRIVKDLPHEILECSFEDLYNMRSNALVKSMVWPREQVLNKNQDKNFIHFDIISRYWWHKVYLFLEELLKQVYGKLEKKSQKKIAVNIAE